MDGHNRDTINYIRQEMFKLNNVIISFGRQNLSNEENFQLIMFNESIIFWANNKDYDRSIGELKKQEQYLMGVIMK